ncbi:MAG: DUF4136 domain-containing protein [Chlorobi bacterium]|nr:DUF4136 domain-containing protein [Chlorobiota bacterium]
MSTLVVDVYDTGTKKLIWQGVVQAVVKGKPEQRDKHIRNTGS